jgi:hypothetical protein
MGNFIEEILNSNITSSVLDTAKAKLQDSKFGQMLGKFGINLGDADLGEMAKGVINVVGLADKSVDKTEKGEDADEETAEGEENAEEETTDEKEEK